MITQACKFGGPDHEFPDDWVFGGPGGIDPAADPRWEQSHYQYLDSMAGFSHMSGQFRCDDAALDYFTTVAQTDPDVKYIAVKRPGESKFTMMPFVFIMATDTVHPYDWKQED